MSVGLIATSERRMVLGLGATGCSVARWWRSQGIPFRAADTRPETADAIEVRRALGPDVKTYFGDITPTAVDGISELVVSPGISLEHPLVARARDQGARVIGDIDLFTAEAKAPVIGVTGSNGKSTVVSMLGAMIPGSGKRVAVGGNLGTPALELLDSTVDYYVLELSSFQLERADRLSLDVAAVLNVSPDHLDRHGTLPRYHQAKHRIFAGVRCVVANRADPLTIPLLEQAADVVLWRPDEPDLGEFGVRILDGRATICRGFEPLVEVDALAVTGQHNINNALAALALGSAAGVPLSDLLGGLVDFKGLPHRCEQVARADGVRWINDSKGTNVGATVAALNGLGSSENVVLVAGGVGKGQDFSQLGPVAESRCRRVITLGEAAREIELALGSVVPCERASDMGDAVRRASNAVQAGDLVLLSPACASFDMFDSYQARGDAFRAEVASLLGVDS